MTEIEKAEIYEANLGEAYLEAGADYIINSLSELKKVIEKIEDFKISRNSERKLTKIFQERMIQRIRHKHNLAYTKRRYLNRYILK